MNNDIRILRDLAKKQMEIASSQQMATLKEDWRLHGAFDPASRPMILIETPTFAEDVISPLMRCECDTARKLERELLLGVVNNTLFGDDTVVKDYLPVTLHRHFTQFGIGVKRENADDGSGGEGLGYRYLTPIIDLEQDFHKLGKTRYGIDRKSTQCEIDFKNEILDGILPARLSGFHLYSGMTMDIVQMMKMEDMFTAMYDYPDLFHKMMSMLTDDYLAYFDLLEREDALLPTNDECHLSQGSYCYNNELPVSGTGLKTSDIWGYMDSQETSGVSPDMFAEFIAPYYRRVVARYGLLSYGCCEAVDPVWDCFLSKLDNLRKVSVSPWANEELMGERLRGNRIVYMRKPSPNLLGVGVCLDEDAVTAHISKTIAAARGCSLELIQRDVYRINNTPGKVRRYVELIRRCCEKYKN